MFNHLPWYTERKNDLSSRLNAAESMRAAALLNTASQVNLGSTFKALMSSTDGGGETGGGEGRAACAGTASTSTTAAGGDAAAARPGATTITATESGAADHTPLTVGRGDAANPASTAMAMGGGDASESASTAMGGGPASPKAGASTNPTFTNTSAVPLSSNDNVHKGTDIFTPKRMQWQIDDLQRQRELAMKVVVKNGGIDPQQPPGGGR